jgi:hypothetical protein
MFTTAANADKTDPIKPKLKLWCPAATVPCTLGTSDFDAQMSIIKI